MEEDKEKKENKEICFTDKVKDIVNKEIENIISKDLNNNSLDTLDQLIDIKKDLENIDYWDVKKEAIKMRYSDYDDGYSEGRYRDYGNYGNYGRRGSGRRYRGHDECEELLEDMKDTYKDYYDYKMDYNRGNYGAEEDGMKALEDTMKTFTEFAQKMIQEVDSPEGKQIIRKHLRKLGDM